jgi:hypothetical protein
MNMTTAAERERSVALMDSRLDEGIRVEAMTVTPELAQKWLRRNHINRALKRDYLRKLCQTLRHGEWADLNGATIVFSENNALLDGQHRLSAVVETQIPITTLVVFGVKEHVRSTIDTGIMRRLADVLSMQRHKNSTNLAAAMMFLRKWEKGLLVSAPSWGARDLFTTYDEALAFLEAHPTLEDSVSRTKSLPYLLKPSHAACLSYRFSVLDAALEAAWLYTMKEGRPQEPYESFFALRERLLRDSMMKVKRPFLEGFVYTLKAWNAERKGKHIHIFRWQEDEALPEVA